MNSAKPGKLSSESYDLILVGTSFASSFFLKKYLELSSPRVRVLVLERGAFIPHAQRLEHARTQPYGKVSFITGGDARKTYRNENERKPWIFDPSFGGSSNCWTGCTPRFMPNDFKLQSKYNVGKDWPLDYDELEPFYCEAENIMSISGPEKTPYPMSRHYPQPPHELSTVDKLLQKNYGDLYISQPTARSSISGIRNKCCTSSICHLCPVSAKFTIENGLSHLYDDARVEVMFQSQVLRLETANNRIQGVVYTNNRSEQTVKGGAVALGANPLFNAHILLNSSDSNPATGHFLSEQVGFYATIYLDGLRNTGGGSIITANGFMLSDTSDRDRQAACLIESHNDFFVRHEHGKWREVAKFKFVFEDIPQFENYVSTSGQIETPVVRYQSHSEYVTRGYEYLKKNAQKLFNMLPMEEIYLDENPQASESHILGTTRMSHDASTGVIDKHLIHHQYRNLFVLGGSSFPSISPANPTLTISALSLWSATKSFSP